jgi:erythromycin esterase
VLQLHPDTSVSRFTVFPRVTGVGTAWFDDLQFEINGLPITSDAPLAPLPTTAELASLRQLQRPLSTAEPGGSDDDLAPLDTIVGDAQVIALGESTHGTSEFHSLSDRIIRHLVRTKGINLVAMESDELAVAKLNHYVLTGAGDLEHARSGVWRVMRTREYAVLYEWLRQYDASKQGHVEIIGFDMQQPMHAIDSVEAFVRRTDPTYARSAAQNYARMRVDVSKFYMNDTIYSLGDSVYALWERGARAVLDHLRMRRGAMTGSDTLDIATAVHNADVALQGAADYGPQANSPAYRDSCMASNLLWQLAHRPGARVVMLAHYAHAARDEQTMGWYLDRALGDRYRPLMMTTNAGSYTGSPWYQMELRRYVAAPLDVGPPESIEGILHGLHVPLLLLDLRGQARDSLGSILGLRRTVRLIGFMTQDWTFGHWTLRGLFDALIFLERTHATTIVPCPGDLVCPP